MDKKIKRIAALTLAIGLVSVVELSANLKLLTTTAYASATNDESLLESLYLYDDGGNIIKFYEDNDYKERVDEDDVNEDETYYAETSSDTVSIDTSGPKDKYVRVFKGTSDSTKGKEVGDDLEISDNSIVNTLVIKVYGEDLEDDTVRNNDSDDNKYDLQSTYKIKIKHLDGGSTSTSSSNTKSDDIYLDRLSVNGNMINLSETETKYTYNVDSNVNKVTIRATPEDDDYDVTIDGKDVDSSDNFKTTVNLNTGENDIKIEIEDNGNDRVYTLVINRGNVSLTSSNETSAPENSKTETNSQAVKNNWVQVNGTWQYKDAAGNTVKDSWIQSRFVKADGNMATGWLNYGGKWYYLGVDGVRETGWQQINGKWYCLDTQGVMQIGWIKDINGKYYYLNSDGSMAYSTKIGAYKLGSDGAWVY